VGLRQQPKIRPVVAHRVAHPTIPPRLEPFPPRPGWCDVQSNVEGGGDGVE
jgi:hypothetical protein